MSFTAYIKKQVDRNDPLGDYAIDFKFILDNLPLYPEHRGTDEITSETLLGHYLFLSYNVRRREHTQTELCSLWKEWLQYKHIGLRFSRPKRGYVYFLRLENEDGIFKIGRTQQDPGKRAWDVARQERAKVVLHDWMLIDHYDIIEKELHTAFKNKQIMREWFRVDVNQIDEAIYAYSLTDSTCKVQSRKEEDEEEFEVDSDAFSVF